ncbi:extracellular catalytic domain type 1 short-chain-length polyhydroxyalkanoate depolymerase [Methylocella silvestris]|uniref:Esterase n=1 Tax=Methylocella silvestris TaxID=199596 RepID=A0A2J7TGJ5_METSI|nr:PHB depolymerase family esterase [Methylocella silvestris]PNG25904.1 esterase [Methylocella silvestris]
MKITLDSALRKATALTSRQNLVEATKVIQRALGAAPEPTSAPTLPQAINGAAMLGHLPGQPTTAPKPLAEMFDKLRHGFAPGFDWAPPADDEASPETKPEGAQFIARSFTCAAGSRSYKLFIPSSAAKGNRKKMPLIVMLHGCKQDPDDFARGTRMNVLAEEEGFLVAYPQQSGSSNQMGCWNWFNLKDQARDSGETAIIAGIAREVMAEFQVDPERVFVAGLSAGGAMAANLSMTHPDIFRAVGIHSGLPCGAATDVVSAFNAMRHGATTTGATPPVNVRTIVFQGGADRTVHPSNADLIVAFASTGIKGAVETRERGAGEDGVAFERTIIADAKGVPQVEYWALEDLGHAWSGGHSTGSFTDPNGPDASREMLRFFMQH